MALIQKKVEFRFTQSKFEGLLGVVVEINNDGFHEKYISTLKENLSRYGITCKRLVMSSADIRGYIHNEETFRIFLKEFIDNIIASVEAIKVFHTRYNSKKLPLISVYGKSGIKQIVPVEFIRKIARSYPIICIWRQCYLDKDSLSGIFHVDGFDTERSPAWDFIETNLKKGSLNVIYKGDQCNPIISTADLVVRYIETDIRLNNGQFNDEGISECLSRWGDKFEQYPLTGQSWALKNMSPYSEGNLDLSKYITHPIVFIPKEQPYELRSEDEIKVFEKLPIYDAIINFLVKIKGTLKHIELPKDMALAKSDVDYLLIMGSRGEELYKYLNSGGLRLKRLDIGELEKSG